MKLTYKVNKIDRKMHEEIVHFEIDIENLSEDSFFETYEKKHSLKCCTECIEETIEIGEVKFSNSTDMLLAITINGDEIAKHSFYEDQFEWSENRLCVPKEKFLKKLKYEKVKVYFKEMYFDIVRKTEDDPAIVKDFHCIFEVKKRSAWRGTIRVVDEEYLKESLIFYDIEKRGIPEYWIVGDDEKDVCFVEIVEQTDGTLELWRHGESLDWSLEGLDDAMKLAELLNNNQLHLSSTYGPNWAEYYALLPDENYNISFFKAHPERLIFTQQMYSLNKSTCSMTDNLKHILSLVKDPS